MNGYRLLLWLSPRRLRDKHAADMEALFDGTSGRSLAVLARLSPVVTAALVLLVGAALAARGALLSP